jgi:hypothetical protein
MAGFFSKLAPIGTGNTMFPGLDKQANRFFFGKDSKMKPFNRGSLNSLESILMNGGGLSQSPLYNQGSNFLQQLLQGGPEAFQNFEAPYLQNFEQNIAPGIAERFAGAGTGGGAMSSSGLQQALAQAGRGLQTDLAGLRSNLQMQAIPQSLQYAQSPIMNMLQAAGLIPGQYHEIPGQPGAVQGLLGAIGKGVGGAIGKISGGLF